MKNVAVKYGGVPERVGAQMTRAQASRLKSLAEEAYQQRQYARDLKLRRSRAPHQCPQGGNCAGGFLLDQFALDRPLRFVCQPG